jgi:glycosyltransferase involved in cell wall biosynthesis
MELGYDIVAYTDHDIMLDRSHLCDDKFLALNGYEMEINGKGTPDWANMETCHINFIAIEPDNLKQACWHRSEYLYAHAVEYRDQIQFYEDEPDYERFFRDLENNFNNKARALITYDRDLSKRIYAAADIFLMPSKSEPCGLSQMIASRYGAIPVTRETGGLYDSIKGYWEDGEKIMGNGFTFSNYSSAELLDRTLAAVDVWNDEEKRKKLVTKIMRTDFSWKNSAVCYLDMYSTIL